MEIECKPKFSVGDQVQIKDIYGVIVPGQITEVRGPNTNPPYTISYIVIADNDRRYFRLESEIL